MSTINAQMGEVQYTPREIEMVAKYSGSNYATAEKNLKLYGNDTGGWVNSKATNASKLDEAYRKMGYENGYNANADYQSLINYAVSRGDNEAAAYYENQRNKKIADMDAKGTNTGGYTQTNNYQQYFQLEPVSYAKYLENNYAKAPTAWNDDTVSAGVGSAIKNLEAKGDTQGANRLRQDWGYSKDYATGAVSQLAAPDWRGFTKDEWLRMNADPSAAANGFRITGGAAGDKSLDQASYADLIKALSGGEGVYGALAQGQKLTYTDAAGKTQVGYTQPTESYLNTLLGQLQSMYQSSLKNNDTAYTAQLQQAMAALERQRDTIRQQYSDAAKQLYIDSMQAQRKAPQQLAALGYTGGLTESSLLGLQRDYEQNMLSNENSMNQALAELTYQKIAAQSENAAARAQAEQALAENYYGNYASIMAQLQAQANYEAEKETERERYEAEQARYEAEQALAARKNDLSQAQGTLQYMTAAGIIPTQEQLMSAYGLTEQQAADYIATLEAAAAAPKYSGYSGGSGSGGTMKLSVAKEYAKQGIFTPEVLASLRQGGYNDEYMASAWGYSPEGSNGGVSGGSYSLDDLNTADVQALGIGPVSYKKVEQLVEQGKVDAYTDASGQLRVRWASGYNADIYRNSELASLQTFQNRLWGR